VSKTPEKFGTGVWEGLASSGTAINASTGGAMIPLLTLGIPGSGATAVMMGAFLLHGVQPGPLLFSRTPESVYTIFAGMLVCNLIMILTGLITARFFSELMRVPENILGAFIISFCLVGAFALRNDMSDVWFMGLFGILGYFMRRHELPIPPLILGVILGPLAESYFLTTLIGEANDFSVFFKRPVSACLLTIAISLLVMPLIRKFWKKEGGVSK
jgi:putative tricarboxylic transport membrane protein